MRLLGSRGFRLLLAGSFLSMVALWGGRTAVLIWVYSLTHSGAMVSLVGLMEALPLLLLAPVAGVFVDRWSRSRTMAVGALCQALALLPVLLVHDKAGVPIILATTLLVNVAAQFSMPAANAAIPAIVGQDAVGEANSLMQLLNSLVVIIAPGLAALVFAAVGPHGLFLLLIALFLTATPIMAAIPAPRVGTASGTSTSFLAEMRAGLRYVRRSPVLLAVMVVAFVALLGSGGLSVLDVVFVTRALHLKSETAGILLTAGGAGQLIGGMVMMLAGKWAAKRYHLILGLTILAYGLIFIGYSAAPTLVWAIVAIFLSGIALTPLIIAFFTLIQLGSEDAYMGRVMSLTNTTMAVAMLASLTFSGALVDLFGVRQVIAADAAMLALSGVLSLVLVRTTPEHTSAAESARAA